MVTLDLQHETLVLAEGIASNLKLVYAAVDLLLPLLMVPQSRLAIKHSVRSCPVGTPTHSQPHALPLSPLLCLSVTDIEEIAQTGIWIGLLSLLFCSASCFLISLECMEGRRGPGEREREPVRKVAVSYTHLTLPTTIGGCRSRWSPYH